MNFLQKYNEKIIQYDLINKFLYKNPGKIPTLEKITLNFGCKNSNIQKFATTLLALEIITSKKGKLSISKNANVLLKIQKGQPTGCVIVLRKKEMNNFLTRLHLEILPKLRNFVGFRLQMKPSTFAFRLACQEILLPEFERQYPLFGDLPALDIYVSTTAKTQKELQFLIDSLKFPFLKNKSENEI